MWPFLKGSLLALTLCLNVGPGLALQFRATLNRGFASGAAVVFGLYLANLAILSIGFLGLGRFLRLDHNQTIAGLAGGATLVLFGLFMILRRAREPSPEREGAGFAGRRHHASSFLRAVAVNTTNPFNLLLWLGMTGIAGVQFGTGTRAFGLFFLGLFTTAVGIDLLKCYAFSRIGRFLSKNSLNTINHVTGFLFILLGILLFIRSVL